MSYTIAEPLGSFSVGDIPLTSTVLTVQDTNGNPVNLTTVTAVQASVHAPNNGADLTGFLTTTHTADSLTITWPATSIFTQPGVHTLSIKLVTATGSVKLTPASIVIENGMEPYSLAAARNEWPDAPDNDEQLYRLLNVALEQCVEYSADARGESLKLAQLMQTRNLWNASKVDAGSGGFGDDTFVIRPFPMDWVVKGILRPKNGVPVIF